MTRISSGIAVLAGAAVLIGALAVAGCEQGHNLSGDEMKTVKLAGTEFAGNMRSDFIGCSGLDSEPDGYVTCTIKDRSSGATSQMLCSYEGATGGCKIK